MLKKLTLLGFAAALLATPVPTAPAQAQAAAVDPTTVQDGAYSVETSHTRVLFSLSHMGFTTWYGEFTNVTGSLTLDPKSVEKSSFDIRVPVKSVSTSNAKVDGELKDAKWLDATQFPEITFKSKQITLTGKTTATVTGDLTLHGVTKPVTLTASFNGAGANPLSKKYTIGFELSGKIKRSDFGVSTYVPLVGDEVTLIISAGFEHN